MTRERPTRRQRRGLLGLTTVAASLPSVATLLGFASRFWWPFDLACHFRMQYFLILAAFSLGFLIARKRGRAIIFTLFSFLNLAAILPLYVSDGSTPGSPSTPLRVMLINVKSTNEQVQDVKGTLAEYSPDLVVLAEVNSKWLRELDGLKLTYPHVIASPRRDNFGIALFSKIPFKKSEIVHIGEAAVPSVLVEIEIDGKTITVFGTHPVPPVNPEYFRLRNQQLAEIPRLLKTVENPVVLLGDLNITPWSYYFQHLLTEAQLKDASRGHGFQPTWPSGFLPFLIPIDHCLYSEGVGVVNRIVGKDVGSDHLPLIVDLEIYEDSLF